MSPRLDRESFLRKWDVFVEDRSLPYYRGDHRLMMRQLLRKYPPGKLTDLSDEDLRNGVNLDEGNRRTELHRSFRYFLAHFGQFLERHGLSR